MITWLETTSGRMQTTIDGNKRYVNHYLILTQFCPVCTSHTVKAKRGKIANEL